MNSKQLSTSLITLCLFGMTCMADPPGQSQQTPKSPITLGKPNKGVSAGRPKAPDRQTITCAYDGEQLHLSFVYSEGIAILSVTDETMTTNLYFIDTSPLEVTVQVGKLSGKVYIEMETELSNIYQGRIE
ncbi:MAG: hypothetical protein HDS27_05755 [Bacteroides sp.]|nr:hypothetical protein [Bacteroides sp.]